VLGALAAGSTVLRAVRDEKKAAAVSSGAAILPRTLTAPGMESEPR
jgi:hypothetical protein